ncbi:MAG: peptidoglycan DD-metalloendopeptidase family protein [Bacteroidota bacterium]
MRDVLLMMAAGVLIIVAVLLTTTTTTPPDEEDYLDEINPETVDLPPVNIQFGVIVDSLEHYEGIVRRNQNVADILTSFDVDYAVVDKLARQTEDVFNLRKFRSNNTYHLFYEEDSLKKHVKYFVYESDKRHYITWDISNPENIEAFRGEKPVEKRYKWSSGTINSSLWLTLIENKDDPLLALELSEIYAWTIDFFDIKKGDEYHVKYEELFVDDERIGLGKIHSALMIHKNEPHYAFYFNHDTVDDYFDEKGASMRRTFLKAPLRYSRISSGYTHRRYHPVLKIYRPHRGVDYAAPTGTPVLSNGGGTVVERGYQRNGGGRYLKIKHNSMYTSTYMHLSGYAEGMVRGAKVKQGQTIGYVGSSGLSTGPHLDFRVYKFGSPVNPLNIKSPPANPVDSSMMDAYLKHIEPLQKEMDERSGL